MDDLNSNEDRTLKVLSTALGSAAGALLLDDPIIELMLNPDGKLWIDRLGEGKSYSGYEMAPAEAERVIFIVAGKMRSVYSCKFPPYSVVECLRGGIIANQRKPPEDPGIQILPALAAPVKGALFAA